MERAAEPGSEGEQNGERIGFCHAAEQSRQRARQDADEHFCHSPRPKTIAQKAYCRGRHTLGARVEALLKYSAGFARRGIGQYPSAEGGREHTDGRHRHTGTHRLLYGAFRPERVLRRASPPAASGVAEGGSAQFARGTRRDERGLRRRLLLHRSRFLACRQ